MDVLARPHTWCGTPVDRHGWIDAMSKIGLSCRFDASYFGPSSAAYGQAGNMLIGRLEIAGQTLSPISRAAGQWPNQEIRLKVVRSGSMLIEQNGQALRVGPGEIVVADPSFHFVASVREPTQLSIVRIPKPLLHDRGWVHHFHRAFEAVPMSADVTAVRDFVLALTAQIGRASEPLLARMGMQCLDLMDVLLTPCQPVLGRRSGAKVAWLAKQAIARRIGDASLDVTSVAAAVNVSPSCLSRALKAEGLSAMRYAYSLRIEHAAQLLANVPHLMIREVADQCGFLNAAHFSRVFKEHHGMTPREFALRCAALHSTQRAEAPPHNEATSIARDG
ncbi:helix-turn-helix transcriptional regulator [Paraburkholderia sp. 2C]